MKEDCLVSVLPLHGSTCTCWQTLLEHSKQSDCLWHVECIYFNLFFKLSKVQQWNRRSHQTHSNMWLHARYVSTLLYTQYRTVVITNRTFNVSCDWHIFHWLCVDKLYYKRNNIPSELQCFSITLLWPLVEQGCMFSNTDHPGNNAIMTFMLTVQYIPKTMFGQFGTLQHTNMAAEACTYNTLNCRNILFISMLLHSLLDQKHLKKPNPPQQRVFLALHLIHFCSIVKINSLYQHHYWHCRCPRHRILNVFKFTIDMFLCNTIRQTEWRGIWVA